MVRHLFCLSLATAMGVYASPEVSFQGDGAIPGHPDAFSLGYQILEETISPDHRLAVMAANSEVVAASRAVVDEDVASNFLVQLQPRRILAVLPGAGYTEPNQRASLAAVWTKDGSAVAVVVMDLPKRADPSVDSLILVQIKDGQVISQMDLLAKMGRVKTKVGDNEVEPDHDKPICRMLEHGTLQVATKRFHGLWSIAEAKWLSKK